MFFTLFALNLSFVCISAVNSFPRNDAHFNQKRYFCCQPRCKAQHKSVNDAEPGDVSGPKRLEVGTQAYLSAIIHLRCLAIQFWKYNLKWHLRILCWYLITITITTHTQ